MITGSPHHICAGEGKGKKGKQKGIQSDISFYVEIRN